MQLFYQRVTNKSERIFFLAASHLLNLLSAAVSFNVAKVEGV